MRKKRVTFRHGLVAIVLTVVCAATAVIGSPAIRARFSAAKKPAVHVATSPVVRTDLMSMMTSSGRVESSNNTLIECQIEALQAGVKGYNLSVGGASTILMVLPEGSLVKKGDVVCELDSSDYEELVRQQTMTFERCRADHLGAEMDLEVAKIGLKEYRDGLMRQNIEELEGRIALAMSEWERTTLRLGWTRRMFGKGYLPKSQVANDEFEVDKTVKELNEGREELRLFKKFFAPKYLFILQSKILAAEATLNYQTARFMRNQERLAHFRKQVEHCTIRAPHSGMLIYFQEPWHRVPIEEGTTVRQKQKLFFLPDLSNMEVETMVHESMVDEVKVGMPARIQVEGLSNRMLEGHVESIAHLPSRPNFFSEVNYFTSIVKLDTIPGGLKPGMSAEVKIRTAASPDVLTIPAEALTIEGGHDICYVAFPDHLERREVKLGRQTEERLEITEGLDEGEEVVMDPTNVDVEDAIDTPSPAARVSADAHTQSVARR